MPYPRPHPRSRERRRGGGPSSNLRHLARSRWHRRTNIPGLHSQPRDTATGGSVRHAPGASLADQLDEGFLEEVSGRFAIPRHVDQEREELGAMRLIHHRQGELVRACSAPLPFQRGRRFFRAIDSGRSFTPVGRACSTIVTGRPGRRAETCATLCGSTPHGASHRWASCARTSLFRKRHSPSSTRWPAHVAEAATSPTSSPNRSAATTPGWSSRSSPDP